MKKQKEFLNTKPEKVTLNRETRTFLLEILENPPEPNEKLQLATKKYQTTNKS
jgi:uncharacterized protein (DUF1778 family)